MDTLTVNIDEETNKLLGIALRATDLTLDQLFGRMLRSLQIIKFKDDPEMTVKMPTEFLVDGENILLVLETTLALIQASKPNDRSDKDRIYAMVIGDLQKVAALFEKYVVRAK